MLSDFIILINNCCNLRCRYCHFTELRPEKFMTCTPERIHKAVRLFFEQLGGQSETPKVLCFNADGEVFQTGSLLSDSLEFADSLRKDRKDVILALVTNATLIDAQAAQCLARFGVSVTVSIDGDDAVHDLNRIDAEGYHTHQRVMQGIGHLREAGVPLSVRAVVTPATSARIRDSYRFLKRLQPVRPVKLRPVRNPDQPFFSSRWISQFTRDFTACIRELLDEGAGLDELPDDALHFGRFIAHGKSRGSYCTADSSMLWMTPDGNLFPCGLLTKQGVCGHIDDLQQAGDISALLNEGHSLRMNMNSPNRREPCVSCKWLPACGGGCPALGLDGIPPLCSFYRMLGQTMEEALQT